MAISNYKKQNETNYKFLHDFLSTNGKIEYFFKRINNIDSFYLKDIRYDISNIKTQDEVISYIRHMDMRYFLHIDNIPNLETEIDCILINGNKGWYYIGDSGYMRYYTKNNKGDINSYNLLDYISVILSGDIYDALNYIMTILDIDVIVSNNQKYATNKQKIDKYRDNKKVKTYLPLYDMVCDLSQKRNNNIDYIAPDGDTIVYMSSQYILKSSYNNKYKNDTQIKKGINLLCYLGLIKKIKIEEVPTSLLYDAMADSRINFVQFYTIPTITDDLIDMIDNRINLLIKNKIKVIQISYNTLKNIINLQELLDLYPQERLAHKLFLAKIKDDWNKIRRTKQKQKQKEEEKTEEVKAEELTEELTEEGKEEKTEEKANRRKEIEEKAKEEIKKIDTSDILAGIADDDLADLDDLLF